MRFQLPILFLASLTLASCGRGTAIVVVEQPRLVSVLVEVYDPVSNLAWENISVRIVEVDHEWSGCTSVNPFSGDWFLTDDSGRVLLDEYLLADSGVGFLEDGTGAAVLDPEFDRDEATVVLEIDAVGFAPVIVEVPISWADPDVFVEVPFF
jgi:hypothetical protein